MNYCVLTYRCLANSGNGLASFYINLMLEDVGISNTKTKGVVNGSLQVDVLYYPPS